MIVGTKPASELPPIGSATENPSIETPSENETGMSENVPPVQEEPVNHDDEVLPDPIEEELPPMGADTDGDQENQDPVLPIEDAL